MESVLAFQGLKSKTSLKPTYATGITGTLMFKKNGTYTVDGLINGGGGVKSEWAYIRNNIFIGKWMGSYPGSLKPEGGFKVGFYGMFLYNYKIIPFSERKN